MSLMPSVQNYERVGGSVAEPANRAFGLTNRYSHLADGNLGAGSLSARQRSDPLLDRDITLHLESEAVAATDLVDRNRSEEHTSELQSQSNLVCRHLLEKKKNHDLSA